MLGKMNGQMQGYLGISSLANLEYCSAIEISKEYTKGLIR